MSILKRIGTHQVKMVFHIKVHYISLKLSKPIPAKVSWKRRNKISETSTIELSEFQTDFSQTLTMPNTIYQKTSGFLPKEAELKILGDVYGSWKELGKLILNISDYIDVPTVEQIFHIQKSSDKDATICLSISTDLAKQKESIHEEQDMDEFVKQLNDTKNKLASLKNDYDEVLGQKETMKSDLLTLQQELAALKNLENACTTSRMQEENFMLKTQAEELKNEVLNVKEANEALKKNIAMKEEVLAQMACKKIGKGFESNRNFVEEEKNEGEIGDQVSKLGERLNDIMRRYTAMPK